MTTQTTAAEGCRRAADRFADDELELAVEHVRRARGARRNGGADGLAAGGGVASGGVVLRRGELRKARDALGEGPTRPMCREPAGRALDEPMTPPHRSLGGPGAVAPPPASAAKGTRARMAVGSSAGCGPVHAHGPPIACADGAEERRRPGVRGRSLARRKADACERLGDRGPSWGTRERSREPPLQKAPGAVFSCRSEVRWRTNSLRHGERARDNGLAAGWMRPHPIPRPGPVYSGVDVIRSRPQARQEQILRQQTEHKDGSRNRTVERADERASACFNRHRLARVRDRHSRPNCCDW